MVFLSQQFIKEEEQSPQTVAAELGLEASRVLPETYDALAALARLYEEQAWHALSGGDAGEAREREVRATGHWPASVAE